MGIKVVFLGSDNVLELDIADALTQAAVTDATVTVTVIDADLAEVSGETWPLSVPHAGSGVYRATLTSDLVLTDGHNYTAVASISSPTYGVAEARIALEARRQVLA